MALGAAPAAVGDTIAGRYRIDAWLGQGAMAVVFRATHLGTSQDCALKLVLPHIVERPEVRELFLKEARVGARIGRNPHIVDVIDAGFDEVRNVPFLAMELLEGEPLDRYIKNHGAASPALVRTIFLQVADALEQAHNKGVVHRDLKPGNLFLTFDRKKQAHIKLVDFGIAKVMEQEVQRTATQIGTPAYAAPEQLGMQLRNIAAKQAVIISTTVGPTTDVWALGLIAYELLIGAPPGHLWNTAEHTELLDLLMGIVLEPTPKATQRAGSKAHALPKGFDEWLERCLRKNAVVRWPSVREAVDRLVALLDDGYEDEATRQMDGRRAKALIQDFRAAKASAPDLEIPLRNSGTLPLVSVPEKPEGPRGTAVMEVQRDAAGRPLALSRPDIADESDDHDSVAGVQLFKRASSVPPARASAPAIAAPAPIRQTLPLPQPAKRIAAPNPAVHFPAAGVEKRSLWSGLLLRKILMFGIPMGAFFGLLLALMAPKTGALRIDVTAKSGKLPSNIEIFVDGTKLCGASPCIVKDLSAGKHVVALWFNGQRVKQIEATVEAGKETPVSMDDTPGP